MMGYHCEKKQAKLTCKQRGTATPTALRIIVDLSSGITCQFLKEITFPFKCPKLYLQGYGQ